MFNSRARLIAMATGLAAIAVLPSAGHAQQRFEPGRSPWGGFYVGVQGGYGWGKTDVVESPDNPVAYNGAGNAWSYDAEGMLGGAHVGLDWESQRLILGLETSVGYVAINGDAPDPASAGLDTVAMRGDGYYVDITGRIGFGPGNTLYYMKGGLALADLNLSVEDACAGGGCSAATVAAQDDGLQSGWTMGVGVAYAFSPRLSMRLEYAYYDFNEITVTGSYGGNDYDWKQAVAFHAVTAGLDFKF